MEPVNERLIGDLRPILLVLLGAVGFVLLIACMNVSNLVMARGIGGRGKWPCGPPWARPAYGCRDSFSPRACSSAAMGCALGLLFARWWLAGLLALLPSRTIPILPGADRAQIDGRVLAVSLLASLATGVVFGLLPAIRLSRTNLDECLKEGGRSNSGGAGRRRWLTGLVVVETALSVILLAGAGVMLRSLSHRLQVQPGFRPEHVLTAQVPSAWDDYSRRPNPADTERKMQYFYDLVERVQGVAGRDRGRHHDGAAADPGRHHDPLLPAAAAPRSNASRFAPSVLTTSAPWASPYCAAGSSPPRTAAASPMSSS